MTSNAANLFQVEQLEQRLLLAADPLLMGSAGDDSMEDQFGAQRVMVAFEQGENQHPQSDAAGGSAHPEMESILPSALTDAAPVFAMGEADEISTIDDSGAATEVQPSPERAVLSATESSLLATSSTFDGTDATLVLSTGLAYQDSPVAERLVETLRGANGPPAATQQDGNSLQINAIEIQTEAASKGEGSVLSSNRSALRLQAADVGNSIDSAASLTLAEELAGSGFFVSHVTSSSESASDVDYFKFSALAGDIVSISLDTAASSYLHLRNSADGEVASDNDGGPYSNDLISGYVVPSSGTYYARVACYSGEGAYTLTVTLARGIGMEYDREYSNDAIERANALTLVPFGSSKKGTVAGTLMWRQGGQWDDDYYSLGVLNVGNSVELSVRLPGSSLAVPVLKVVNSKGEAVVDEDLSDGVFKGKIAANDSYYAVVSTAYWVYQGHRYQLVWGTWEECEAEAVKLGGHLATLETAEEESWVRDNFNWDYDNLWIGMTDRVEEGKWVWVSGSSAGRTNWADGQPQGGGDWNGAYKHGGNGMWYAGHKTWKYTGLVEMEVAGDAGVAYRGPGAWGQYVMDVKVGDEVAPVVAKVNRLPIGGKTGEVLGTFSVEFSEALGAASVNAAGALVLTGAGSDGLFGSGDDVVYGLSVSPVYSTGTVVSVVLTDGPMGAGKYRLVVKESVVDVVGNKLDGDGNGSAGGNYAGEFEVVLPVGYVFEGRDNGSQDKATALVMVEGPSGYWVGHGIGSMDPREDNDWWSFEGKKGDRIAVGVDDRGSYNGYFYIFYPDGRQWDGENDGGPYSSDYQTYTLPEDGKYAIRVKEYDRVGNYEIRVEQARGIDLESDREYRNDSIGGANGLTFVQDGNVQKGVVAGTLMWRQGGQWDDDYYSLGVLNVGNSVELSVRLPGSSLAVPVLKVVNSKGEAVVDEDLSDGVFKGKIAANDSYYAVVSTAYWVYQGHRYQLVWGTWEECEAEAVKLGGHLATLETAEEESWVRDNFNWDYDNLWIGMTDRVEEGKWVWVSGSSAGRTNWADGQPQGGGDWNGAYKHGGNGMWYAGHKTWKYTGLVEMEVAGDAGVAYRGPGAWGQYVMDVKVGDEVAPVVAKVNRLPIGGKTGEVLGTFSVEFSEALGAASVNAAGALVLTGAGSDGLFGSGDDVVYGLSVSPVYSTGTVVSVVLTDGPMGAGKYRLVVKESVVDVVGNKLDGDGNGSAGGNYAGEFEVVLPVGYVFEGRDNGSQDKATALVMVEGPSGYWVGHGIGSMDPREDNDWWSFEGKKGDRIAVGVDDRGSYNGYFYIFYPDGRQWDGENDGGPYSSDYQTYTLPEDGKYAIRVKEYDRVGNYEIRVEQARGIDLESDREYRNDSIGSADVINLRADGTRRLGSMAGTVMAGQSGNVDEDYFSLGEVQAGQTVLLSTRLPLLSTLRPLVEIRSSANQVVSIATNPSDAVARADVTVTGNYYAVVVANGGEGPLGQYVLDAAVMPTSELSFADLVIIDKDTLVPGAAASGQSIRVQWRVGNFGAVATPAAQAVWVDRVVLSTNARYGDGDDVELGVLQHTGVLGINASYSTLASLDVVLPKGISGEYFVFIKTDVTNAVSEFIFEENNVGAAMPLTVSLTPAADLEIGGVRALSELLVVGGDNAFQWTVTNFGDSTTGNGLPGQEVTSWKDKIVLSVNDVYGDGDDIVVQEVTHTGKLEKGASYQGSWTGKLPAGTAGTFYVIVATNSDSSVYENRNVRANSARQAAQVRVVEGLFPDLKVVSVGAPGSGTSGQGIRVEWQIKNDGLAATGVTEWSDRIYITNNAGIPKQLLLGTIKHLGGLELQATYTASATVNLPIDLAEGNYFVFVEVDGLGQVGETGGENNNVTRAASGTNVLGAPVPDLVVRQITVPLVARLGDSISIGWTVKNTGGAAAGSPWIDKIYLSKDGGLTGATQLGTLSRDSALGVGEQYETSATFTVPVVGLEQYFVVVVTDAGNTVFERASENNNSRVSDTKTMVVAPNLSVSSVTIPANGESGATISGSWTVRNGGTASADGGWIDRLFLSRDQVLSAEDVALGDLRHEASLNAGQSYTSNLSIQVPDGSTGTYYVLIKVDATGVVVEGAAEGDNVGASSAMLVTLAPYADLKVTDITAQSLLIGDPVDLTVAWKVTNQGIGAGRVDQWTDRIILSTDEVFGNGDDKVIASVEHNGAMPVGSEYSESKIVTLASALQGRFYVYVAVDAGNAVFEGPDTGANVGSAGHPVDVMFIPYADLVVDSVTADSSSHNGGKLKVSWVISNKGIGITSTDAWTDSLWWSKDPTGATGRETLAGISHIGALGVDDGYPRTVEVDVPLTADGQYYVFVTTGGPFEFLYTGNNTKRSEVVTISYTPPPPVDLEATVVAGPTTGLDQDSVEVSWTVRNNGPNNAVGTWTDTIYLAPGGDFSRALRLGDYGRSIGLEAGKTYTRSETVRLPSQAGSYSWIVVTNNSETLAETSRSNNRFTSDAPLLVALRPRPDLQVTEVKAPLTVTSGGYIDVEWTVRNLGPASTPTGGSRWTDGVYLSLDHKWDSGDLLLGSLPNGSALDPTQGYSSRGHYQIKLGVAGTVYIVVRADSESRVDEYPQEANNDRSQAIAVDVTPVPPPDLVTSDVNGPADVYEGSAISVHYRVTNKGAGVTFPASWTDAVWLVRAIGRPVPQPDSPLSGDILLGRFGHGGALEVGQFYENTVQVTIPKSLHGVYHLAVWADTGDTVYEQAFDVNQNPDMPGDIEGSNFGFTPINVFLVPPADLEVTNLTVPPVGLGGKTVTMSWTVTNRGAVVTDVDRWGDSVYLSTDSVLDDGKGKQYLVFAAPHEGILQPGQSYTQTVTFTLPPSAEGSYYIVKTNVAPIEIVSDDDFDSRTLKEISDQFQAVLVRIEDRFGKPLDEVSSEDLNKLSRKDLLDILVGPGQQGDRLVFEGPWDKNNTRSAASKVSNVPADLTVRVLQVPSTATSDEAIELSWEVKNVGAGSVWEGTTRWYDNIFLSPDPPDRPFDVRRATFLARVVHSATNPLRPGDSYVGQASVTLPQGISGRRFIYVLTDYNPADWRPAPIDHDAAKPGEFPSWPGFFSQRVWENGANENNIAGSAPINVLFREPDLQVVPVSIAGTGMSSGYVALSFKVANLGSRATRVGVWFDRIFISQDQSLDQYDQMIGSLRHEGVLGIGGEYTVTTSVRLPDNIQGDFYLIVFADSEHGNYGGYGYPYPSTQSSPRITAGGDGAVREYQNEDNNSYVSPIKVQLQQLPDLVVTEVTSQLRVYTGESFTLSYGVKNDSVGDVSDRQSAWYDQIYLSRDQYLDAASDPYVGLVSHTGGLASAATYTVSNQYRLPRGLLGAYYVFVVTDVPTGSTPTTAVYEGSKEGNNARATLVPMLIELPPPSDLQVVDPITVPTTAVSGGAIEISWNVKNFSTEKAQGYWTDAVYLSTDAVWDIGDRLVGKVDHGSVKSMATLNSGESYNATLKTRLPALLPQGYRIIVRTDIYDDVNEGAFNKNNMRTSAEAVQVTVETLVLNVSASSTLTTGQEALFRVLVPAGETLEVSLSSSNASAANELYLRYEDLPNSIHYDAAPTGHMWADQVIRVPATKAGYYYVLARGASVPGSETITLKARLLPFGIVDVSPDTGGDGRYVTFKITGAKFDPAATVKLIRPQLGEYLPVTYKRVDATLIIAVFDLRNAPHGLYDVQVANPDGAVSRVPYRYLVERALPLDLTVGLGGPAHLDLGEVGWYGVGIYSLTNVDAPYVHLEFGVPRLAASSGGLIPGEKLVFRTNLSGNPSVVGVPWAELDPVVNLGGDLMAPGFTYDFVNQGYAALTFTADTYPELRRLLKEDPKFLDNLMGFELEDLAFSFISRLRQLP